MHRAQDEPPPHGGILPKLYRCRTGLAEVAALVPAEAPLRGLRPTPPRWSAELWPNRIGLVVREWQRGRIIEPMRWGLPRPPGTPLSKEPPRTCFWHRDPDLYAADLLAPANRCLIILDSFAHADGPEGGRTRTWYGYDDLPIFTWAGVWRHHGRRRGFAGILVPGAEPVTARAMPAIVAPEQRTSWLRAAVGTPGWSPWRDMARALYREATEQPWGPDHAP